MSSMKSFLAASLVACSLTSSALADPGQPAVARPAVAQAAASALVGTAFPTPEDAARALGEAIRRSDRKALQALFGPRFTQLEAPDPAERAQAMQRLIRLYQEGWSLSTNQGGDRVIRLGAEGWSFPVPMTKTAKGWQFDTEAGLEEVANRRVGRNELALIETCRLLMKAQSLYHQSQSQYTVKLASTEGQKDGLYWPATGEQLSPLAQTFGDVATFASSRQKGAAWYGYYFDVRLTPQGYLITAWPQRYLDTGVMSFACDQSGQLYEQDLGPEAGASLRRLETIDSAQGWRPVAY